MSSNKFADKVAIITGSSSGIGQGIALLLAQQGAAVVIHGRSQEGIEETVTLLRENGVAEDKIHRVQGDISEEATAEQLINEALERFGRLDVLVNNAGIGAKPGIAADSEENLDCVFNVNFKSVVRLNKLAVPHLEKTSGNIVNISSVDALQSQDDYSYYACSKASLDHYMRHLAKTLARKGIRVNNVNPGLVRTNLVTRMGMDKDTFNELVDEVAKKDIPLGRTGTPKDIANAVSYLVSDEASYVTGTTLVVDGGVLLGKPKAQ
ncbi:hypothetical protein L596_020482 [Steinernema carpocapsae]|uniref:Uncharacterized protein n=1 Tax=Steinernema carpocapsae TaxID=34508 RepID=A0A4U5MTN4_STECR|nr:hypothetical protein L596_020482 [Steinernema carpocapsae]